MSGTHAGTPAYPIWSILIIALDMVVIYALAGHGREVKRATTSEPEPGDQVPADRQISGSAARRR